MSSRRSTGIGLKTFGSECWNEYIAYDNGLTKDDLADAILGFLGIFCNPIDSSSCRLVCCYASG